ncbi:RND family efflux transporter, MFP subunit [Rivularia sp. PCC 7116]|uniref:efflux RND transporter periplasmic adaptor subunit n=1 Tax=Rivularia sp. PCC 7116 TaxID=373994 RepID=UPI00029EE512|nr:efflux RND transporter periplasmic adaptor subunit [Rivularia sp. PCC 7116]AFY55562.1 RND family efflux transporter, MFP subunit [Rivularia sp. PCC 7116]
MKTDVKSQNYSSSKFHTNHSHKKKNRFLFWLLGCACLGGIVYTLQHFVVANIPQTKSKLLTAPVTRQNLNMTISANGTIQPERTVNVSPKNAGILKKLLVNEGVLVKQGQIIAYMDDVNLQGELIQARAKLASAEANLQKLKSGNRPEDIIQAQAQLEESQANLTKLIAGNRREDITQALSRVKQAELAFKQANEELGRYEKLFKAGAISRQNFSDYQTKRDTSMLQLQESQQALALKKSGTRREDIEQAQAKVKQFQQALKLTQVGARKEDIEQARAEVNSARGSLQTIQARIYDTVIRAPFDGLIAKIYAEPGSFVTPTTSGSAISSALSSSILSLTSKNQVVANVAESNISKIKIGQKVKISVDAYPQQNFLGRVSQIASQATIEQNVTSFEVKIALVSDKEQLLKSGMNVSAEFQIGELENSLVVPTVAIIRQQNQSGVYIVGADNKPQFVSVKTGVTVKNKTQILSGITADKQVLISSPPGIKTNSSPPGIFPPPPENMQR